MISLSAVLNLYRLTRDGYANLYYAATVKSMLQSWHNLFFASFDPGGFVTVDKPPLGFWVQAAFARVLGFSAWSVLLPQALAGCASVAVLYALVRRDWGPGAGLLAALGLAVTPVAVAVNRNNTIDSLLVLVLLLAAWCTLRGTASGRLRWLLAGMALVGAGFNIKMMQAYLALPALVLVYLLGAPLGYWKRLWHIAAGGVLVLAVSFAWVAAVDLTPADARPYVGSSLNNTALELTFGHNGLNRLFGFNRRPATQASRPAGPPPAAGAGSQPASGPPPNAETGTKGALRLLNRQLGGQASWLLATAITGAIGGLVQAGLRQRRDRRWHHLALWAGWLAPAAVFFSIAGFFHAYYLVMLGPPVAALTGIGLMVLWGARRRSWWGALLIPAGLGASVAAQIALLRPFPEWSKWLTPTLGALTIVAIVALLAGRVAPRRYRGDTLAAAGLAVAIVALYLAPVVWSYETISRRQGALPAGGPLTAQRRPALPQVGAGLRPPGSVAPSGPAPGASPDRPGPPPGPAGPALIAFLQANRADAAYLLATPSAQTASPFILATGQPVMALGGFSGNDPIVTPETFASRVRAGQVRFVLLSTPGPPGPPPAQPGNGPAPRPPLVYPAPPANGPPYDRPGPGSSPAPGGVGIAPPAPGGQGAVTRWIQQSCRRVPLSALAGSSFQLLDCAVLRSR